MSSPTPPWHCRIPVRVNLLLAGWLALLLLTAWTVSPWAPFGMDEGTRRADAPQGLAQREPEPQEASTLRDGLPGEATEPGTRQRRTQALASRKGTDSPRADSRALASDGQRDRRGAVDETAAATVSPSVAPDVGGEPGGVAPEPERPPAGPSGGHLGERRALRLAQESLGAQRFSEAEVWAQQALAEDPTDAQALLALVQSLHLQGDTRSASQVLRGRERQVEQLPGGREWIGMVALARGRHLEAFRAFDALASGAGAARADSWRWRGEASRARGDLARAETSFARSVALGSRAELSDDSPSAIALGEVRAAQRPRIRVLGGGIGNSLGLGAVEVDLAGQVWAGKQVPLELQATVQHLQQTDAANPQEAASMTRAAFLGGVGQVFPLPALAVEGHVSYEQLQGDGVLGGDWAMNLFHGSGSSFGIELSTGSLWRNDDPWHPRYHVRIEDISAVRLGPRYAAWTVAGTWVPTLEHKVTLEGGTSRFADSNDRGFLQATYQWSLPIRTSRAWIGLRPGGYAAFHRLDGVGYHSPRREISAGVAVHAIGAVGEVLHLEAEVQPTYLSRQSHDLVPRHGASVSGLARVSLVMPRFSLGFSAFGYHESMGYQLWRVTGTAEIPF